MKAHSNQGSVAEALERMEQRLLQAEGRSRRLGIAVIALLAALVMALMLSPTPWQAAVMADSDSASDSDSNGDSDSARRKCKAHADQICYGESTVEQALDALSGDVGALAQDLGECCKDAGGGGAPFVTDQAVSGTAIRFELGCPTDASVVRGAVTNGIVALRSDGLLLGQLPSGDFGPLPPAIDPLPPLPQSVTWIDLDAYTFESNFAPAGCFSSTHPGFDTVKLAVTAFASNGEAYFIDVEVDQGNVTAGNALAVSGHSSTTWVPLGAVPQ